MDSCRKKKIGVVGCILGCRCGTREDSSKVRNWSFQGISSGFLYMMVRVADDHDISVLEADCNLFGKDH